MPKGKKNNNKPLVINQDDDKDKIFVIKKPGSSCGIMLLVKALPRESTGCFLNAFDRPKSMPSEAIAKHAECLKMADTLDIKPVNFEEYSAEDLLGGSRRELSTFVLEHSHFVNKFMAFEAVVKRDQVPIFSAAMVANVCEELIGLQNWLFQKMGGRSRILVSQTTLLYLRYGSLIMDKFWEDKSGFARTFTVKNAPNNGIGIEVDDRTDVGSKLTEEVQEILQGLAEMASRLKETGSSAVFVYNDCGELMNAHAFPRGINHLHVSLGKFWDSSESEDKER